jgi:transcriptional regulator with XRE-family HTH domain
MKKLSDQLREAIEKAGVSRYEIAKATGVSQTTLCRFVSGERGISVDAMDAIGQYLGLSIVSQKKRSTK